MITPDPRANPLARGPLQTRDDVARAVTDLYEPLRAHVSPGGARVRLGSYASVFEQSTAELEGFARPLYGIVPLAVGGHDFAHWDRFVSGLDAGTDPDSAEYWGPVPGDNDQRMVEQAAIGLALAFCPQQTWEHLSSGARDRLVGWLQGIFDHDPNANNWQFFRVLVALGLERVGAPFDAGKVTESLDLLDSYRVGRHWYVDGALANVDYYVPFAFHTYGLMYAAANDLGLGDDVRAAAYRERASTFAADLQHWFAPDGAAVPFGRSLTYRFAMASFWGALAWADVESELSWGAVRGLSMRHLRWWADQPISDRDGVLSIGYTYDNRRLSESYNSAGSPYWCMKAFGALAATADHPFWTSDEVPLESLPAPVTIADAGQVIVRDDGHAMILNGRPAAGLDFPEQAAAKYRKFAYSSVFGFSGDVADMFGSVNTDSMLALTTTDGHRRVRLGTEAAGVEAAMTWSTWRPWPDVRVDSVCWAIDASRHGRIHRIRSGRELTGVESGFAIGLDSPGNLLGGGNATGDDRTVIASGQGVSAIVDLPAPGSTPRRPIARNLAVNATLVHPRTAVPALTSPLPAGDHTVACLVYASPRTGDGLSTDELAIPTAALDLLERCATQEMPT
ncbi:MAG TPA: DUF2264 domain-containing protein [Ilumatobacteraceae bacterium]|nr:DUF2264 domain-containing protein [Ilumatobacteraceae bacterium]